MKGTGILHFGSVSLTDPSCRDTIVNTVSAAKRDGAIITYDPNYRAVLWQNEDAAMLQMRAVLPLCDIVKISDEETMLLCGVKNPHAAAQKLMDMGVKLAVVTLGPNGALWRFGDLEGEVEGFKVKVADTNGAGDTFFGALLSRIALHGGLEGPDRRRPERIRALRQQGGHLLTTSRPGAISALPTEEEVVEGDANDLTQLNGRNRIRPPASSGTRTS